MWGRVRVTCLCIASGQPFVLAVRVTRIAHTGIGGRAGDLLIIYEVYNQL